MEVGQLWACKIKVTELVPPVLLHLSVALSLIQKK